MLVHHDGARDSVASTVGGQSGAGVAGRGRQAAQRSQAKDSGYLSGGKAILVGTGRIATFQLEKKIREAEAGSDMDTSNDRSVAFTQRGDRHSINSFSEKREVKTVHRPTVNPGLWKLRYGVLKPIYQEDVVVAPGHDTRTTGESELSGFGRSSRHSPPLSRFGGGVCYTIDRVLDVRMLELKRHAIANR